MADPDYLALFGGDSAAAGNQAQLLAEAIRQRRAGGTLASMYGAMSGDKSMQGFGTNQGNEADKLEQGLIGAAQHRASQDIQRQHLDVQSKQLDAMMGYRQGTLGVQQQKADQAAKSLDLKASERGATTDAFGNPILYQKHGQGGALPGAVAAAGGGAGAAGAGGGGMGMTPGALDQAAELYARTGTLPPLRGKAGAGLAVKIQNRAAELHPESDLALNKGTYKADSGSLSKQTQLLDLTKSWEATGKANLGVLRDVSGQLVNAGSPLANKPLRWLYEKAGGDPTVTKFKAAHAAVVNEYAKILSGSMGSAGVTEGARHEAENMLPLDSTPAQIAAAADLLETDAGNRLSALTGQVSATRQRIGGKAPGSSPGAATHRFNPATGKIEAIGG